MSQAGGNLVVISAPSGAGKSTLIERLMHELSGLAFSVSFTTRAPRTGERDGVAYHFTDRASFRRLVDEGAFLEWAEVHGEFYGTARAQVQALLDAGIDVVLDIDVQGAAQVRESGIFHRSIFVLPPGRELLLARLVGRGSESEASLNQRMANALKEMRSFRHFDYLVINQDLEEASEEMVAILRAARASQERRAGSAREILRTFEEGAS